MSDSENYVKPPENNTGESYVTPPQASTSENYVTPPKTNASESYVQPPRSTMDANYVAPPKTNANESYVTRPQTEKVIAKSTKIDQEMNQKLSQSSGSYSKMNYFGTPKVGIPFYITGYLIFVAWSMIPDLFGRYSGGLTFGNLVSLVLIVISNYTYSWFSDYQRAKGGTFSWFFTAFGGVKTGMASSLIGGQSNSKMTEKYQTPSDTNGRQNFIWKLVTFLVVEFIKLPITFILAIVSVFTHKSTIRKYEELVYWNNN